MRRMSHFRQHRKRPLHRYFRKTRNDFSGLRELGAKGGIKGGTSRAARMTPEERSESARRAVQARWAKARGQK